MVSWMTTAIAASLGLLTYLLIPILANALGSTQTRKRVGDYYYGQAAKIRHQFVYLRRVLGGISVLPITVDPEQKTLKVTLASHHLSDDNEYPFTDPDNRIKRLYNKPAAVAFEHIPAALDAELSELGYWVREKRINQGFWKGDWLTDINEDGEFTGSVDPFVRMKDSLRLVDPADAFEIVPSDVDPENLKTAESLTLQRFAKYGPRVSLEGTISAVLGYLIGIGSVAGANYIRTTLIEDSGGLDGGTIIDVPMTVLPDLVVTFL